MGQAWALTVAIVVALISGASAVLVAVLPVILKDRDSRKELLARTETSDGKTLAQVVEELGRRMDQRMDHLATKDDVDRVERKLEEHTETFGHPKLVEMIGNMSKHLRPRDD